MTVALGQRRTGSQKSLKYPYYYFAIYIINIFNNCYTQGNANVKHGHMFDVLLLGNVGQYTLLRKSLWEKGPYRYVCTPNGHCTPNGQNDKSSYYRALDRTGRKPVPKS